MLESIRCNYGKLSSTCCPAPPTIDIIYPPPGQGNTVCMVLSWICKIAIIRPGWNLSSPNGGLKLYEGHVSQCLAQHQHLIVGVPLNCWTQILFAHTSIRHGYFLPSEMWHSFAWFCVFVRLAFLRGFSFPMSFLIGLKAEEKSAGNWACIKFCDDHKLRAMWRILSQNSRLYIHREHQRVKF